MGRRYRSPYRRSRPRRGGANHRGLLTAAGIGVAAAALGGTHPKVIPAAVHAVTSSHAAPATVTSCGGSNEALADCMAAAAPYGWTGGQATCLDDLWTHESGFDAYAANPASDARGIPQNIDGWSASYQPGNASQQISWGLTYISGRYGTPCAAWAFETSHVPNWY